MMRRTKSSMAVKAVVGACGHHASVRSPGAHRKANALPENGAHARQIWQTYCFDFEDFQ